MVPIKEERRWFVYHHQKACISSLLNHLSQAPKQGHGTDGAWGRNHTQSEEVSRLALNSWWQNGCCIGDFGTLGIDVTHWNPDAGCWSDFSIVFLSKVKCGPFLLPQCRRNVLSTRSTVQRIFLNSGIHYSVLFTVKEKEMMSFFIIEKLVLILGR